MSIKADRYDFRTHQSYKYYENAHQFAPTVEWYEWLIQDGTKIVAYRFMGESFEFFLYSSGEQTYI
jgi:hypothetical protein